jgi:hypothetical protein
MGIAGTRKQPEEQLQAKHADEWEVFQYLDQEQQGSVSLEQFHSRMAELGCERSIGFQSRCLVAFLASSNTVSTAPTRLTAGSPPHSSDPPSRPPFLAQVRAHGGQDAPAAGGAGRG